MRSLFRPYGIVRVATNLYKLSDHYFQIMPKFQALAVRLQHNRSAAHRAPTR